jgi:hypothetical protein
MTETKDTTQTMRDTLRQHGLPVAWAEWVTHIRLEKEGPEPIRYTRHRPQPPERYFRDYDDNGDQCTGTHTDEEMVDLWAQYGDDVKEWSDKHWTKAAVELEEKGGGQTHYTAKLTGSGASLTLTATSYRGPWRAVEWTARPSGRGLSMIESLVVEWFDAEGWMKSVQPGAACNRDETAKNPKLSADDITAALWDMPGKERAVVLYPFWPAISEAAQRTLLAEERATAAMAYAAHYRCLLNDCRRVLTTAEDDRDAARKERDEAHISARVAEQQRDRFRVGNEAAHKELVRLTGERDDALRKLAEAVTLPTGTSGMVQGADGWEYPKEKPREPARKPPAFISGPFRGASHWDIAQNVRRAEAVALAAWRSGLFSWVYCPHANTAHFQDAAPDEVWIEGHLEAMRAVHREGGVVLVVPDWEMSKGTQAEIDEAFRIGMPVFEAARFGDYVRTATKAGRITRPLGRLEWVEWKDTLAAYLTELAGRVK